MTLRVLPTHIDNSYAGHKIALWITTLVVTVKSVQSLLGLFAGAPIAASAHGIALDTFTPGGAQAFVAMYGLFSYSRLLLIALALLVLIRYRSAIPLMLTVLLAEHFGRVVILYLLPLPSVDAPSVTIVNAAILMLLVVGLALSLRRAGAA